jgi:hypothetical protein
LALVVLAAGLMGIALPAQAITFDITSDHCTGGCGPSPYGTVTVTQVGANVDITVDLAAGIFWAKTGAADFQEVKFNGTGVALGDITVNQTFPSQTLAPQTGAFNGDGTGTFTFGIACTTCGNGSLSPLDQNIVFHVANATVADVTTANAAGNIFVVDIFSSATGNTGPVDVSGVITPEPGSLLFFAPLMALAWMVGVRRWKRQ